ncbi:MAG TPA: hypothetical protein VKQ06_05585 [Gammaproteobacteria bacterium]|nr:hypothetical protein [Gammaproteobacteria bacterium]
MRLVIPLILSLFGLTAAAQDGAQDGAQDATEQAEVDSEPERCVRTRSIRRTKVIDDQTIAFFMRNGDVLINSLPNRCPQLAREDRFAYTARAGQLCNTDVITVLLQFAGRLENGFTCRLSDFVPANEETVEIMITAAEDRGAASPVSAEPVDLPPDESEAEQPQEDAADNE